MASEGIHIAAVHGSVRPNNFTAKAMALVVDELRSHGSLQVDWFDPAELELPPPGLDNDSAGTRSFRDSVAAATGVVLATPEYHGGYSSVIKRVIENLGFPSVLAGKPVALLGVAAGQIGAIKALEQLRSVCSHIGAIVLPGAVSVPGVQGVFDADGRCLDEKVEQRIRSVATNLINYIQNNVCPRVTLEQMAREKID